MELKDTMAFVDDCIHDAPASCECACPYKLNIRAILKKTARGRFAAAYRDLRDTLLFPTLAAEKCPRPCMEKCQRIAVGDGPIDMGAVERYLVKAGEKEAGQIFSQPPRDKTVAVVGAGAAGLTCAVSLSRKKYAVTVFDRQEGWGGGLRDDPMFPVFAADFEKQFQGLDTEFRFGTEAEEADLTGFDAVYIATGEGGNDFGLRESWDPALRTTSRPGWFMGGGVCGEGLMESVAAGNILSQLMEAYLMTGRAALVVESDAKSCEGCVLDHPGEESKPAVVPADPEAGFTKDEIRAEAGRCMQCQCSICLEGCEVMAHYLKTPYKLAAEVYGDSNTRPPFSNCVATRQTYSCNMCSWCRDACPTGVDMGELFRFSREDRWKKNKWIPGLHDYWLRELDRNMDEGFYASPGRCGYVFFPGCQLAASAPGHVESAWRFLREKLDAGILLGCCGSPAVWAGDADRREKNAALLRDSWERMGRPVIVTACATCAERLPEMLEGAEIRSLYEVLDREGAPVSALPWNGADVFDPCSARKDDAVHRAVRSLAEKAGCAAGSVPGGKCCGYGGHIRLANPELYGEITENRVSASEKPYIVYCANCLEVFRSRGKECVHILDAVFGPGPAHAPDLEEKRMNTVRLKDTLMKELENKSYKAPAEPWDALALTIPGDVRAAMEDKLITDRDVKETIMTAEAEGDYFVDGDGMRTACLMRKVLTYWVDYVPEDGGYAVKSAYCHRMHIGEEETQ